MYFCTSRVFFKYDPDAYYKSVFDELLYTFCNGRENQKYFMKNVMYSVLY